MSYGKLLEIIVKCVLGGFDRLTTQTSHIIYAVVKSNVKLDWSNAMFERLTDLVKKKKEQRKISWIWNDYRRNSEEEMN